MAESMVREALKHGMKSWIVTSERVRTIAAQFREEIEDVVFEARQEYESQSDTKAQPDSDPDSVAVASAPRRKVTRTRASREGPVGAPGDAQDAKASAGIATAE